MSFIKRVFNEILDWSKAIIFAIIVTFLISVFLVQPYTVVGSSMEPTFQGQELFAEEPGDRVLIFKTPFLLGERPDYYDIVVIDHRVDYERTVMDDFIDSPIVRLIQQNDDQEFWIKRIIGKPGDTLEYKDGKIYRNGHELNEDYIKEDMITPFETIEVPANHVYVMGDNRNNSKDSREIGPVPMQNVLGKVVLRFFPFDRFKYYH
ncbi:signal peptidase I [Caldalkalibacillus salinus]|uniref:signal peptidase I n=1 Tax=Caldalkalibacillus salinus TaxID=2803787 RepID=UPI001920DFA7|nr:signal peptidase I [Caldalkalibacillus salinus]